VNESEATFGVNQEQQIRFGLSAIKGVGEAAVEEIILERRRAKHFQDVFSLAERVNLKAVSKKTFENLAMAGAFDSFSNYHRRQYLWADHGDGSLIEKAIRYGQQRQQEKASAQQSLFVVAEEQVGYYSKRPAITPCTPYEVLDMLKMEKEVVGFYISGHPLDRYKVELTYFCNCHTQNVLALPGKEVQLAGVITESKTRQSKHGKPFGLFTVEDYEGTLALALFGEDFLKNQHLLQEGTFVYITGHVIERYHQAGVWELRPRKLSLLSEIRDKLSKSLQLHLSVTQVSAGLVTQLEQVLTQHPGACALTLTVAAPEEAMRVVCLSRNYSIHPSNELFDALRPLEGITFRLQA
jgi:DNA polymerase III subunit alpha